MADFKLYTLDEVADIVQVTKRTLYRYIDAGTLHAVKVGKYWRVSAEKLEEFISTGTPIVDKNRRPENQG